MQPHASDKSYPRTKFVLAAELTFRPRVLLLASSGFLSGNLQPELENIISQALHAGVLIDSLDSKGLYAEPPGGPLNDTSATLPNVTMFYEERTVGDRLESEDSALATFAESTGGLFFRNNNDLDLGFRELGLAPEYAYELGFKLEQDSKYHKILANNPLHDFVQARPDTSLQQENRVKAQRRASTRRCAPQANAPSFRSRSESKPSVPRTEVSGCRRESVLKVANSSLKT